jgi:hypothetical protein
VSRHTPRKDRRPILVIRGPLQVVKRSGRRSALTLVVSAVASS